MDSTVPLNVPAFLQQVGEVQRNLVHLLSSKPRGWIQAKIKLKSALLPCNPCKAHLHHNCCTHPSCNCKLPWTCELHGKNITKVSYWTLAKCIPTATWNTSHTWYSHSSYFLTPRFTWVGHWSESQGNLLLQFEQFLQFSSCLRQSLHEYSLWLWNAAPAWESYWSSLWVTCGPEGCVALCYSVNVTAVIDIEKWSKNTFIILSGFFISQLRWKHHWLQPNSSKTVQLLTSLKSTVKMVLSQ